jgi:cytochrome c biogenesis protein CcmG, thiol:disulfide interchange protein DsbE
MNGPAAPGASQVAARDTRKLVAYGVVVVLLGILATQYLLALAPAAQDDRTSACRALQPTPFNPRLGMMPVLAPEVRALDYTKQEVQLSAYRGRVTFVNFWQTACAPCIEEMPAMDQLQRRFPDLAVLAYASELDFEPVHRFFKQGTAMTVLLDPPEENGLVGKIAKSWGTEKWPETYLVDKRGVVRYYYVNSRNWASDNAVACIQSLLAE